MEIKTQRHHRLASHRNLYVARFVLQRRPRRHCKIIVMQLADQLPPPMPPCGAPPQAVDQAIDTQQENALPEERPPTARRHPPRGQPGRPVGQTVRKLVAWAQDRLRRGATWLQAPIEVPCASGSGECWDTQLDHLEDWWK